MKRTILALFLLALPLLIPFVDAPPEPTRYELGEVVWSWAEATVSWSVTEYPSGKVVRYRTNFHTANMDDEHTTLPFPREEAARMQRLFGELVTVYAVESTQWFLDGGDTPTLDSGKLARRTP